MLLRTIWNKIKSITKREPTQEEARMMNTAFNEIVISCNELMNDPNQAYEAFHATTEDQKNQVVGALSQMTLVFTGIYSVATKFHPISWIGLGFCVPFIPGRPIMLSVRAFEDIHTLNEVITHEFSHSKLRTIDGKMGKGISSDKFEELIEDAWVWTFLV